MNSELQADNKKQYAITWKSVDAVQCYANNRYKHFDQRFISWRECRIVDRILSKLKSQFQSLLDIPSGYGRFTQLFLNHGFDITNGDLNLYALKYQRELHSNATKVVVSNVNATPFRDNQFDIVFNFRLLQHLKTGAERERILKELQRITKRWVIVSVYIYSSFHRLTQKISTRPRKMTMAERKTWENEIKNAGFRIVGLWWVVRFFHAHKIYLLEKSV